MKNFFYMPVWVARWQGGKVKVSMIKIHPKYIYTRLLFVFIGKVEGIFRGLTPHLATLPAKTDTHRQGRIFKKN
jgi:hypothetical protein